MKFKNWILLQDNLDGIHKAVEADSLCDNIEKFVSTACSIPIPDIQKMDWEDTLALFLENISRARIDLNIPMFSGGELDGGKVEWEYDGRNYFSWVHPLCREYGWSLDYVDNLDHNQALALLQEIEVERQLQREWEWGMTEIAYPYNETTKKSSFHPLERPIWMKKKFDAPKKTKILKSSLPSGLVVIENES